LAFSASSLLARSRTGLGALSTRSFLFQPEAGQRPDFLDHLDLLVAGAGEVTSNSVFSSASASAPPPAAGAAATATGAAAVTPKRSSNSFSSSLSSRPTALKCRRGSVLVRVCHVNGLSFLLPVFRSSLAILLLRWLVVTLRRTRARLRLLAPRCLGRRSVAAVSVSADSEVAGSSAAGPASSCAGTASGWPRRQGLGGRGGRRLVRLALLEQGGEAVGEAAGQCLEEACQGLERRCDGTGDTGQEDVFDGRSARAVRSPGLSTLPSSTPPFTISAGEVRGEVAQCLGDRAHVPVDEGDGGRADEQRLEPAWSVSATALRTRVFLKTCSRHRPSQRMAQYGQFGDSEASVLGDHRGRRA